MQSATVVVVKTSELVALAAEMKTLLISQKKYGDQLINSGVQRLDYTANFPVPGFDFGDFLDHNFNASDLVPIKQQLGKTILYKAATPAFLGLAIHSFSGLTCYIPQVNDANLNYYKKLEWYTSSGLNMLFVK